METLEQLIELFLQYERRNQRTEGERKMPDQYEDMRSALVEAREKLIQQDELIKALTEPPLVFGAVCKLLKETKTVIVSTGNGVMELQLPKDTKGITPGASVRISYKSMQIVGPAGSAGGPGPITRVKRLVDKDFLEIEANGQPRLLFYDSNMKIEVGDLVIPDSTGAVIVSNIGKPEVKPPPREALVSWDDIGGLMEAKAALQEAVEMPYQHPELYERYGRTP